MMKNAISQNQIPGFVCLTNGPKFNDIQLTSMKDKEKQQIQTFENLEPANVFLFAKLLKSNFC